MKVRWFFTCCSLVFSIFVCDAKANAEVLSNDVDSNERSPKRARGPLGRAVERVTSEIPAIEVDDVVHQELEEQAPITLESLPDLPFLEESVSQKITYQGDKENMPSSHQAPSSQSDHRCNLLKEKNQFNLWASFLYWHAQQDYMDIAKTGPNIEKNPLCGFSYTKAKEIDLNPSFRPAVKVGASLGFDHTNWKLLADYTYFESSTSKSREQPSDGFLFVKWIQPNLISNNASQKVKAKWELEMNVLNTQVGRSFYFGSTLSLLPYLGIATAWIEQDLSNHLTLLNPIVTQLKIHDKSHAFEIGPRLGISANYNFFRQLGISANIAGEILYAHYGVSTKQRSLDNSAIYISANNHFSRANAEFEIYAGLYYRACFGKKKKYLKAEVGYDFQVWWAQNMIRWYNDLTYIATPVGNLYLQGLRVSLNLGF
jgi:hypothetical protein